MRGLAELVGFGLVALALHLAALAFAPGGSEASGAEAGGSGGLAVVALAAPPGDIAAVLDDWTRPPEAETALPEFAPSEPPAAAMALAPAPQIEVRLALPAELAHPEAAAPGPQFRKPPQAPEPPRPKPRTTRPAPKKTPPAAPAARPASKPAASPGGPPTQRAAGSGGGTQAGNRGRAAVATASGGRQAKLVAVWGTRLRARIERRKRYPAGMRGSAEVRLRFRVAPSGRLLNAEVIGPSGQTAFDRAALKALSRAQPFPRAPGELTAPGYSFVLTTRFGN